MSAGLSLWDLEIALVDLAEERDRLAAELANVPLSQIPSELEAYTGTRENLNQQLAIIDNSIMEFIRSEIKKVDNIADYAVALDYLCHEPRERSGVKEICELDREIAKLVERRDTFRGRLERLKASVKSVMEVMPWKPGKTKKLEGVRHSITLQGNGGALPVEIHDETLIPAGLMNYTVTMPGDLWVLVERAVGTGPLMEMMAIRSRVTQEPSNSRISEALARPCDWCKGTGSDQCLLHGHTAIEQFSDGHFICGTCGDEGKGEGAELGNCPVCGGSKNAGVPGARLGVRDSSVRIK